MKFNFFAKRHKCAKCGKKFKDEIELRTTIEQHIRPKLFFRTKRLQNYERSNIY